ncbi:MAG: oligogalacturonate lyase family protein [Bryobacteraceae bacterium]|nr:oligogalacturonate lyase family protein [Bryobacteraceae bacterium]
MRPAARQQPQRQQLLTADPCPGPAPPVPGSRLSRRLFLAAVFAAGAEAQGTAPAGEWRKYLDPATEFEVFLLTDPQFESFFPSPPAMAVDRRSRTLVFSSRRNGMWQPWAMDLAAGISRPLGTFSGFLPQSLTLLATGREAALVDGEWIKAVTLGNLRPRDLAQVSPGAEVVPPLAPAPDGTALYYAEKAAGRWLLQRLPLPKGAPAAVVESAEPILLPAPNPRRAMLLWRTPAGVVEVAAQDGTLRRRLETPPGRVLEAWWSPDGQAVVYLHESAEDRPRCTIREQALDSREDRLVAPTTQFGRFARNANASVFLGASRSAASPLILILLRVNRRELPLCEHKASDVAMTNPIFTPDSQRILFVSDRLGKPAIFMVNVEKLIERTDT